MWPIFLPSSEKAKDREWAERADAPRPQLGSTNKSSSLPAHAEPRGTIFTRPVGLSAGVLLLSFLFFRDGATRVLALHICLQSCFLARGAPGGTPAYIFVRV